MNDEKFESVLRAYEGDAYELDFQPSEFAARVRAMQRQLDAARANRTQQDAGADGPEDRRAGQSPARNDKPEATDAPLGPPARAASEACPPPALSDAETLEKITESLRKMKEALAWI